MDIPSEDKENYEQSTDDAGRGEAIQHSYPSSWTPAYSHSFYPGTGFLKPDPPSKTISTVVTRISGPPAIDWCATVVLGSTHSYPALFVRCVKRPQCALRRLEKEKDVSLAWRTLC